MINKPARLLVQRGTQKEREFELTQAQSVIGRSPDNDIPIPDPEVSRRHAQIVQQGDEYAIVDLGSTNGTFVNNVRVKTLTPLRHNDQIRLGDAIDLRFVHTANDETVLDPLPVLTPDDEDTAPLPPLPPVMTQPSAVIMPDETAAPPSTRRTLLMGCAILLVLICLCTATVFFLDAYDQGRLLYCGGLRPLWEIVLGPLGFAPICP
jgi:pSer/pThr/pTyr-binding forkhead associated (FHA) protein